MAKSQNNEYRDWLVELKGNPTAQAKELAIPVAVDIASGLTGWWLGRQMGRASLAVGFLAYAGGKVHSLHETINREEQRLGISDEQNRPALSGFNPLYKNPKRVYHGESPLVAFGMGMMLGGAFAKTNEVNGLNGEALSATEKAKSAFSDITEDLKYRLYLDKIFKGNTDEQKTEKKKEEIAVNGLSDLDIFIAGERMTKDLDFSKLDEVDNHLEASAFDYDKKRSASTIPAYSPTARVTNAQQYEGEEVSGFSSYSRII